MYIGTDWIGIEPDPSLSKNENNYWYVLNYVGDRLSRNVGSLFIEF